MRSSLGLLLILFSASMVDATEEGFLLAEPGVELYWTSLGSGEETLILPGGFLLEDGFVSLADEFRVIFYDMRNRGRSSTVTDPVLLTLEADVDDLEAVRAHFGIERFSTIGYSYLGKMVVLYAMRHPGRLQRIVQIGAIPMQFGAPFPIHLDNTRENVLDREAVRALRALRANGLVERDPREYCEREWEVARARLVGDASLAETLTSLCRMPNEWPSSLATHLQHHVASARKATVSPAALAALEAPVLTVHGTRDRNAPYGAGREWAAMLPNARLLTVEGAAHRVWTDHPGLIAEVSAFLRGQWPASSVRVDAATEAWLSQMRGVAILTASLRTHLDGGRDEEPPSSFRFAGATYPRSQSRSASPPFDPFPLEEIVTLDAIRNRLSVEQSLQWPDFVARYRIVADGAGSYDLDLNAARVQPPWESPEETTTRIALRLPHILLHHALRDRKSIRYIGLELHEGEPLMVVNASVEGATLAISVDEENRVRRISRLTSSAVLGDILEVSTLHGWQQLGQAFVPREVRQTNNGILAVEVQVEMAASPPASPFTIPNGFARPADAPPTARELELISLGEGIAIVTWIGGADYRSLVVEGDDGLFLVETPQSTAAMQEVVKLLDRRLSKRITTAVVTHHHFDHSGGVRAVLAAGARLLVPASTVGLFESIAAAPRVIEPDGVEIDTWSMRIDAVDSPVMTLELGGRWIEIHTLRETGHAEEMLFVWIPGDGILFQGDLFVKRDEPEAARRQAEVLLNRIDELQLPVRKLVGVHGDIATLDDLREAVALSAGRAPR